MNFGGSRCHPPFFWGVFSKVRQVKRELHGEEFGSMFFFVFLLNSESKAQFSDDGVVK